MNHCLSSGVVAVAIYALGLVASTARADTTLWNSDFSGSINSPANWTAGVPDGDDDALFIRGPGASYTVTFPGVPLIQGVAQYTSNVLNFGTNTVNFVQSTALHLGPSTYTLNSAIIIGAPSGPAVLSTSLSSLSSPRATIGLIGSGHPSTLNIDAGTFTLTGTNPAESELVVGNDGAATLNVAASGQVNVTGAAGDVVLGANAGVAGTVNLNGGKVSLLGAEASALLGRVAGATGTINVSGQGAAWSHASDSALAPLVVGGFGSGSLHISAGGRVDVFQAAVAKEVGSVGSVTVQGAGSAWTNRGESTVGGAGNGTMTIAAGGRVNDNFATLGGGAGGMGTAHVAGNGSIWTQSDDLRVGAFLGTVIGGGNLYGRGHLQISAGGRTNTLGDASVVAPGSNATVDGSGSAWNVGGELSVQFGAALDVKAGATLNSHTAFVGSTNDGTATLQGAGSSWNVADVLSVGRNGTGTINVAAGAHLNSRLGFLGVRPAVFGESSAQVHIDGAGSKWTSEDQLFIGYESQALLLVTNGGQVTSGTGQIGFTQTGNGRVSVAGAGSRWTNTESLYLGVAGVGSLAVVSGGTVAVEGLLSIGPRGNLEGNSTVQAKVRNAGTVAPGLSFSFSPDDAFGTLHLDGDYTQTPAGSLQIQLAAPDRFDKLTIAGRADLAGSLEVLLTNNGYSPTAGTQFEILRADQGVFNSFAATTLPALNPGLMWNVVYSNFAVHLQVRETIPGDFNANGAVENADLTLLLNNWGAAVPPTPAGWLGIPLTAPAIDNDELTALLNNWGNVLGSGALAATAIPEPSAWLLTIVAAASISRTRRR